MRVVQYAVRRGRPRQTLYFFLEKAVRMKRSILTVGVLVLLAWGAAPSRSLADLILDPGDILISNHTGNNVQRLQPNGTVTTLVTIGATPIGLTFDNSGNLYINANNGILKVDKTTSAVSSFFTGVGQREGLTFSPVNKHLYSASFGGGRIEEVDLAGNLVRSIAIAGAGSEIGVATRGNNLIVSDFSSGNVYLGTLSGNTFQLVGNVDPGNTYAVAMDAAGNIYANDFAQGRVVKFTPGGGGFVASNFITGLNEPANGLSIGDDGSFTISEFGANAVSVWNSDGTLRHRFFGIQSPDELVVYAPLSSGIIVSTPEPGTLTLVGLGVVGLLGYQRCRRKQAAG
jgi:YD repeat-containing protein